MTDVEPSAFVDEAREVIDALLGQARQRVEAGCEKGHAAARSASASGWFSRPSAV